MSKSMKVAAGVVGGGVLALVAVLPVAANATTVPKPSASCKTPVFSVSPMKASPGTKVTVSGVNFSGCTAQGNKAKPTPVLTVRVGVESASKMGKLLATTRTSASGSFKVQVTVPSLSAAGVPKLGLAAAAKDPATGLTYAGVAVLAYSTPGATSAPGGGVPTAVPAGSGGLAASTSNSTRLAQDGLAAAGVALLVAGGIGFGSRRASGRQQH
jgi:hypothetical protein